MMKLTELYDQKLDAEEKLRVIEREYQEDRNQALADIKYIKEQININSACLDAGKIGVAEALFKFEGDPCKTVENSFKEPHRDVRGQAVEDAINYLIHKPDFFKSHYVGVKNYSGFGDQREDHRIGFGPRHGSTVFSIRQIDRNHDLQEIEIEAVIYYLHNWKAIFSAKKEAA